MMKFVVTVLALLLSFSEGIVYVPHAKTYLEAKRFCRRVYGTALATIANDDDRNEAIADIGAEQTDEAWIGLYARNPDRPNWRFLAGDDCPSDSRYKCVDFWLYQLNANTEFRPRCVSGDAAEGEGGYECAYFDAAQNGVDNNKECGDPLPFFCEGNGDAACEIPGSVQRGYSLSNLDDDGWTQCYKAPYNDGNTLAQLTGLCPPGDGIYYFVGALENSGSTTAHVGAFAPSSVLVTRTYDRYVAVKPVELVNDANYNIYWHNSDSDWISGNAFGFSPEAAVNLYQADTNSNNRNYRLSWHMDIGSNGNYVGGWSAGEYRGLNGNSVWNKIIYYKKCASEETLEGQNPEIDVGRQYRVVSGAQNWADAQQSCQDTYGTDLATIITQTDMNDAIYMMDYNDVTRVWIGLNDIDNEGDWVWVDGTPCTNNDGTCSDLWDFNPNNNNDLDTLDTDTNIDCGLLTNDESGSTEGNDWDGTTKLETSCDDQVAVALCNAPGEVF